MGQQQLLLLVLGIVIVGLAVAVSINAFAEKTDESDFDAITSEAIKIASDILTWKMRPSSLGGGNGVEYLTGLTFDAMGYQSSGPQQTRANTSMYMRSINHLDSPRPYVIVRPQKNRDLRVQLFLYGPDEDCLVLKKAIRVEGEWQEASISTGVDDTPANCSSW